MLVSIQILRGIAALLVVVVHAVKMSEIYLGTYPSFFDLGQLKYIGGIGVDIFFVISGFIMCQMTYRKPITNWHALIQFAKARFYRIVPLYWLLTLLFAAVLLIAPSVFNRLVFDWWHLLNSMLFIPYQVDSGKWNPVIAQGWTLTFEFLFYSIFVFSLFFFKKNGSLVTVAIITIIYVVFFGQEFDSVFQRLFAEPRLIEFSYGVLLAVLYNARVCLFSQKLFICINMIYLVLTVFYILNVEIEGSFRGIFWGITSLLIVSNFLIFEKFFKKRNFKLLSLVGDSSYSLYLVHNIVLAVLAKGFSILLPSINSYLFILFSIVFSILFGIFVYKVIERPLMNKTKKIMGH